jgi:hypothetical protein
MMKREAKKMAKWVLCKEQQKWPQK